MAFVWIISCEGLGLVGQSEKSEIWGFGGMRVIPSGHELQATVSLTLPESDYDRNLRIFEVCDKNCSRLFLLLLTRALDVCLNCYAT
jgi:hypothetical protein